MADDSSPTLANALAGDLYGAGYQNPALGGDEIYGTSDMLRLMAAQKASREREGPDALARLLMTLGGLRSFKGASAADEAVTANRLAKAYPNERAIMGGGPMGTPYNADFLANFRTTYGDPYRGYGFKTAPREGVHSAGNPNPLEGNLDSLAGRLRYMRPANSNE